MNLGRTVKVSHGNSFLLWHLAFGFTVWMTKRRTGVCSLFSVSLLPLKETRTQREHKTPQTGNLLTHFLKQTYIKIFDSELILWNIRYRQNMIWKYVMKKNTKKTRG